MKKTEAESRDAVWEVLTELGKVVTDQGKGLASLTSVVEGWGKHFETLAIAQKDARDQHRIDHTASMDAIHELALPKDRPWTPYAILVVAILSIFGVVLGYQNATTKELAQKDKELANLSSVHANEVAELKFRATTKALEAAQASGQSGFQQINGILAQQQTEITRQWEKMSELHNKVEANEMDAVRDNQSLLDLKEYTSLTGQEMNNRLVRISDKLQDTNVSAGRNETALRATGDYLREHTTKQGAAGHPSPTTEVRVKEQPIGVTPP
jgi:uncharacterized coiled-coil protein SlyX